MRLLTLRFHARVFTRSPEAAILSAIDYKMTFLKTYESEEESEEATSQCHTRSARRVLRALLANGGAPPDHAVRVLSLFDRGIQAYSSNLVNIWLRCECTHSLVPALCIDRVTAVQDCVT